MGWTQPCQLCLLILPLLIPECKKFIKWPFSYPSQMCLSSNWEGGNITWLDLQNLNPALKLLWHTMTKTSVSLFKEVMYLCVCTFVHIIECYIKSLSLLFLFCCLLFVWFPIMQRPFLVPFLLGIQFTALRVGVYWVPASQLGKSE